MCEGYRFKVDYFEDEDKKIIKADLFSDEAERVVRCFLVRENDLDYEYKKFDSVIKFKCYGEKKRLPNGKKIFYGRNEYSENCPKDNRKLKKQLSSTQIRKFYEEVLNLKERVDNGEDFRKILPYFKMLKAKANVAYQRDVINTNFKSFIEKNVDYVGDNEERFKIFCTFFEAVVAYSKGTFKD